MSDDHPGYEPLVDELNAITGVAPPFIYINDPVSPRTSASVVASILSRASQSPDVSARVSYALVDAITCFHPRLLYDTVLNQLAGWQPRWADGCVVWGAEEGERWNQNVDGFLHGLKAVEKHIREGAGSSRAAEGEGQMVILVENAERLQDNLADLVVPLTRLAELTQLNLSMVFISEVRWDEIRPPFGGSPDPYYIDVKPLDKQALMARLNAAFQTLASKADASGPLAVYHPHLRALYGRFAEAVVDTCAIYVQDSAEMQYIAAARWPGFVQPVLDAYAQEIELDLNSQQLYMRLFQLFKTSFKDALETLYPRRDHAFSWAIAHAPETNLLERMPGQARQVVRKDDEDERIGDLPRMAKYILIAAYIASTNPQKSDLRMFGRGLDEKKRKRRAANRVPKSGVAKLPQRVLGPNPFPLDRLLAILGALLEENDADRRPPAPEYTIPGEYTDMETSRVGVQNLIIELADAGLLQRSTATDKLDGATFKCGVSYKTAETLSRQLDVQLNDLLWDPA
ncbi:hypothetical protein MKEN_00506800 [Mycena kentingensis (nom. inval.)]|nr:hypothetical protein MKEN_00506800 [Mycena kentingensis (nom. inval.)]